jgi:hypothetical protein
MRSFFLCSLLLAFAASANAQYAPQAGISGSTAIARNSPVFKAWATGCHVQRGLQQINNSSFGYATLGDSTSALGTPNGDVVSLGDSGYAILTFATPITNGPGADFAVFENGFANTANSEEAFLELAFVEVSSDGVNYTRFPASSLTQDTAQLSSVASPSYTNARDLNNLAGKYISTWGTPFDLNDLPITSSLDVTAITHVRLVDAIGSIGPEGSKDASGRKINDPFPTPFAGSGFDLDALGVINAQPAGIGNGALPPGVRLYPNPASEELKLDLPKGIYNVTLFDATGRRLQRQIGSFGIASFQVRELPAGSYFITVSNEAGNTCSIAFSHY